MLMWDRLDNNLIDNHTHSGSVDLVAGETYQLQIRQYSKLGSYKLLIGYQKESIDISDAETVFDRITYDTQMNVYYFTPSETRDYTFSVSEYTSGCKLRLMAWDKYDNSILDTTGGEGTVRLEAGQTYQLQVRQYTGHTSYRLQIQ